MSDVLPQDSPDPGDRSAPQEPAPSGAPPPEANPVGPGVSFLVGGLSSRRPSPGLGLFLSLAVYPGCGQAMNRRWFKAAFFALLFTVALGAVVTTVALGLFGFYRALVGLQEPPSLLEALRPAFWPGVVTLGMYIWAALDAWLDARRQARAGPPSR